MAQNQFPGKELATRLNCKTSAIINNMTKPRYASMATFLTASLERAFSLATEAEEAAATVIPFIFPPGIEHCKQSMSVNFESVESIAFLYKRGGRRRGYSLESTKCQPAEKNAVRQRLCRSSGSPRRRL